LSLADYATVIWITAVSGKRKRDRKTRGKGAGDTEGGALGCGGGRHGFSFLFSDLLNHGAKGRARVSASPSGCSFLSLNLTIADSRNSLLVGAEIFAICFVRFGKFSTGMGLDKFSTGRE
jgi:hypothetical protein